MKTIFLDFVDRVERAVPVALLVCVPALCAGLASAERVPLPQNKPSTTAEDQNLRDQVIALVHQALRQGSGVTSEGVRYSTYLPPSAESIAVIQHLGERAI